ncbi:hypothetical protein Tco_0934648, partial [Tanacetum coccineum]
SCLPQLTLIQRLAHKLSELRAPEFPPHYLMTLMWQAPLTDEEFEVLEPSDTRNTSSQSPSSLDSTAPLSPDHLLTQASPTQVLFHRRTARMAVHTQPTLSPGMSARIAERYRGTSELVEDIEEESSDSDAKREGSKDEGPGSDDESRGLEDEGLGSKKEEEAALEGQQQAVLVVKTVVDEPLGLGYGALIRRELALGEGSMPSTFEVGQSSRSVSEDEGAERISAFRQSALITWVNPKDGRVYTDILTYVPPVAHVLTPPSPKWSSGSFQRENHNLRRQITKERHEQLELTDRVARMERRQESGGE